MLDMPFFQKYLAVMFWVEMRLLAPFELISHSFPHAGKDICAGVRDRPALNPLDFSGIYTLRA
jgi:hypothetical protein